MAKSWVGTKWRAVSRQAFPHGVRYGPDDVFTFTQEMEDAGYDPAQWVLAGVSEFVPEGVTLAPRPLDDPEPPVADVIEPVAPVGRRKGKRLDWPVTATEGTPVEDVEVPDADAWTQ
jgi:hypothetical protein